MTKRAGGNARKLVKKAPVEAQLIGFLFFLALMVGVMLFLKGS